MALSDLKTVTVEMSYEDALRLWALIHDPRAHAVEHRADARIRKLVTDAVAVVESDYEAGGDDGH